MNKFMRGATVLFFIVVFLLVFGNKDADAIEKENYAGSSAVLVADSAVPSQDLRVEKLRTYLEKHNSPLSPYAEDFVKEADNYHLGDQWALPAAIAGVESTFGKFTPKNSYNAWGWGIPTGAKKGIGFEDWSMGITTVTAGLKTRYIDRGAESLAQIGRIYAPPSNTWAGNVQFFMDQIENTPVDIKLTI